MSIKETIRRCKMNENVTLWINENEPDILMKKNNIKEQIELLINKRKFAV